MTEPAPRIRRRTAAATAALLLSTVAVTPALAAPGEPQQEPRLPRPAPSVPIEEPIAPPPQEGKPRVGTPSVREREYWLEDYGVRDVWGQATGKGVKIAVIDTGVDSTHQDLKGSVTGGADVSGKGDSQGRRGLGAEPEHGTLVASLAAGRGHGARSGAAPGGDDGVLGVAPDAQIIPISLWLGNEEPGVRDVNQQIPDAVRQAVDQGADVINMSVGSDSTAWPEEWDAAFAYAEEKGVLVVAAAGNRGSGLQQVGAPATIPGVLSVGGVDRSRKASWDSSSQGISIAVAGPSEDMVGAMPGGGYAEWSGTSATVPLVSGTAALIKQKHPELKAPQIAQRIIVTAHDAGAPGKDPLYGYGVLDVQAAVEQDVKTAEENPLGSMKHWIAQHRPRPEATASATAGERTKSADTEQVTEEAAPPRPRPPINETGALPVVILTAFGVVVAGLTTAAVIHIRRLSR